MFNLKPISCPKCGECDDLRIVDKGIRKVLSRFFSRSNRLVCNKCSTSWRRNNPTHFSPIKRKHHSFPIYNKNGYLFIKVGSKINSKFIKAAVQSLKKAKKENFFTRDKIVLDLEKPRLIRADFSYIEDFKKYIEEKGYSIGFVNYDEMVSTLVKEKGYQESLILDLPSFSFDLLDI